MTITQLLNTETPTNHPANTAATLEGARKRLASLQEQLRQAPDPESTADELAALRRLERWIAQGTNLAEISTDLWRLECPKDASREDLARACARKLEAAENGRAEILAKREALREEIADVRASIPPLERALRLARGTAELENKIKDVRARLANAAPSGARERADIKRLIDGLASQHEAAIETAIEDGEPVPAEPRRLREARQQLADMDRRDRAAEAVRGRLQGELAALERELAATRQVQDQGRRTAIAGQLLEAIGPAVAAAARELGRGGTGREDVLVYPHGDRLIVSIDRGALRDFDA
jgi:chromosome segregation ATPase